MKKLICALTIAAQLAHPAVAADTNGDFAIRGAGRISCAEVIDSLATKDQQRLTILATWVEGYITAQNQLQNATFDATPWQTTELIMALAGQACQQRGNDTLFMDVIGRLVSEMRPLRLAERSELVTLNFGDAAQVHYQTTVERARARLEVLGYTFTQDGILGPAALDELSNNISQYQETTGLPVSGQLDQNTLLSLFVQPAQ